MADFVEFAKENWYLFLALAGILGWLIGAEVMRRLRGVSSVTPVEALQLINHQDAVVLDIRDGGDYKNGHIPQAQHIPANDVQNRLNQLQKYKDKPIIVYCRTGMVSEGVCALLKQHGFAAVHSLSGGVGAWQSASLPLTRK